THDVDVSRLKKVLKKKISKKSIIVGHLAPYVLTKSQISKAIILRKNPYSLSKIYKKRKYSKKKTAENLGSEVLGIIAFETIKKFGKEKTFQVDTTSKSILKISKQLIDIINGKSSTEIIDWLSVVAKKNDLQKFFSY
ncbi:MAG: shikimate kinase, partial [Nitrosopumilaceae archaeon]